MKKSSFSETLSGGDPRSLGRTGEVVALVLKNPDRIDDLYRCLFHKDEIVRMRSSDALEKVCSEKPSLLIPFTERLLTEVAAINQASVRWHLAQMLAEIPLNTEDTNRAIQVLKKNLSDFDDWIVTNLTLESMGKFASDDPSFRKEFTQILRRYEASRHKSIQSRVRRLLLKFGK